ncbi:TPA: hypothetical protein R5R89_003771 [Salmonella enterica]|nr:hypothetical protein [Salmonella enterica]
MNKYKITLLLIPVFYSSFCNSGDTNTITYGYDKLSSEIYATNGDIKKRSNSSSITQGIHLILLTFFLTHRPLLPMGGRYTILQHILH